MGKLTLTKDPSHSGYYLDGEGNLYVFRFGGRPIKVDGYREDKPRENVKKDKVEIESEKIINHKKSASLSENNKFIEEVEKEKEKNKKEIDSFIKKSKDPYGGKDLETLNEMKTLQRGLNDELSNTEHRNEDLRRLEIGKELAKESDPSLKNASEELLEREGRKWLQYNDGDILEGEPYKNYKGELEVPTEYLHNRLNSFKESEVKTLKTEYDNLGDKLKEYSKYALPSDKEDKEKRAKYYEYRKQYSQKREEYNNKLNEILKEKQNLKSLEKIILEDQKTGNTMNRMKMIDDQERWDRQYNKKVNDEGMSEEKFKELWGERPKTGLESETIKANQELRKHDAAEITKLKDRYEKSQGVSDDWFTEEGRKLGMKDEDIANAIYIKKGAEAQGSTDDNIKRIIANTEKQHYERLIKEYKDAINNPKTGEWDREFMKSELPGLENKAEMFANYEAEFIKRVNRDDEVFNVKYRDPEFLENFKARGLDEAYALKDEWLKYSDDVHIYDSNGNEILEDSQKHYTSPTYEKNKINEKKAAYRERLHEADRSTLISMIHNLGLNWNVERFTDQQLYRMLEKELNKKGK